MPDQNPTSLTVDVTALVAELERAWAPPPPPVRGEDDEDDVWEGDDCGCGGEDGYGRPICNCGDGCGCESCTYSRHSFTKTCSFRTDDQPPGARCGKPTRYRVIGWRPGGATSVQAEDVDPSLAGTEQGQAWIEFDERPMELHTGIVTACSREHAYKIAAQERARYNKDRQDSAERYRFRIEQYRYEPMDRDLPDILAEIRAAIGSLRYQVDYLVKAGCRVADTAHSAASPNHVLKEARRHAARLVARLTQLDIREQPPRRWRAGDPLPDGVRSVLHRDGDTLTVYDCYTEQDGPWKSFNNGDEPRHFDSWEQLLASVGEVTQFPRYGLVVPGEPPAADHD